MTQTAFLRGGGGVCQYVTFDASLTSELSTNLFAMSQVLAEDNTLKKQSIEMKGNQIMMQKMTKIREFEKEIEEMQGHDG
jgi:hypothetical protein